MKSTMIFWMVVISVFLTIVLINIFNFRSERKNNRVLKLKDYLKNKFVWIPLASVASFATIISVGYQFFGSDKHDVIIEQLEAIKMLYSSELEMITVPESHVNAKIAKARSIQYNILIHRMETKEVIDKYAERMNVKPQSDEERMSYILRAVGDDKLDVYIPIKELDELLHGKPISLNMTFLDDKTELLNAYNDAIEHATREISESVKMNIPLSKNAKLRKLEKIVDKYDLYGKTMNRYKAIDDVYVYLFNLMNITIACEMESIYKHTENQLQNIENQ